MLKVTFFGTTTLLFDDGEDQILFDAHFTRPSIKYFITGKPVSTNCALCDEIIKHHEINRLKAIFVSHAHHDHAMDAPYVANKCGAKIYGTNSVKNIAIGGKVKESNIEVYEDGSCYTIGKYKIKVIKALHSKPTKFFDNVGEEITEPLAQPATFWDYKEGGSYDFYIEHEGQKILLHPSFNYIEGQLDGIEADVVFLGVAGIANADKETVEKFFDENVIKTKANLIIPVHWDNFFSPLDKPIQEIADYVDATDETFYKTASYCAEHLINFLLQYPCTSIELK